MGRRMFVTLLTAMAAAAFIQPAEGQDQPDRPAAAPEQPVLIRQGRTAPGAAAQVPSRNGELLKESIRKNTSELEAIREQIKEHRERIKSLDQEESDVRRGHQEIQQEIELSHRFLGDMAQQERVLQERSTLLKEELEYRRRVYGDRKATLAKSLRSMYMRSQHSDLELVLTSRSFSELLTSVKVSRTLARLGGGLLEEVRTEGQILQREQRQLNAALSEIWQSREEQTQENERLEYLMAEQIGALRGLETARKDLKNEMLQMGLNEQKLSFVLSDLEQVRVERSARTEVGDNSLVQLAGHLEWPVRGNLIRGFGRSVHPKFKTVTLNNGYNIAAPAGAPVAAVADGTVEFSDQLPGFGQCVILDHDAGYYTLYAHLEGVFVAKGEKIARGQVIAEVGRPTAGDEPQLYFEVRQGRTPLDPADWLLSR